MSPIKCDTAITVQLTQVKYDTHSAIFTGFKRLAKGNKISK